MGSFASTGPFYEWPTSQIWATIPHWLAGDASTVFEHMSYSTSGFWLGVRHFGSMRRRMDAVSRAQSNY